MFEFFSDVAKLHLAIANILWIADDSDEVN